MTVRDVASDFHLQLRLNWVGYPLERKGSFASSDTELKSIWETCAWTQQCCSLDAYVDTPWREQTQWWGDARVQAWNTFHLAGDARLFRRGIAQIAAQTTPDGVTYGHAPTMAHSCILPDFTLIWMLTIWDYYWQTGSTEPLLAHHEIIQNALAYFRDHSDPAPAWSPTTSAIGSSSTGTIFSRTARPRSTISGCSSRWKNSPSSIVGQENRKKPCLWKSGRNKSAPPSHP